MDARNGLATPPPVICGRRPVPRFEPGNDEGELFRKDKFDKPVGWALRAPNPGVEFAPVVVEKAPKGVLLVLDENAVEFDAPGEEFGRLELEIDRDANPLLNPFAVAFDPFVGEAVPFVVFVPFEKFNSACSTFGVVDSEPGIGGRVSSSEAPNDDVGLKGLRPENPVVCGWIGGRLKEGTDDALVEPVG